MACFEKTFDSYDRKMYDWLVERADGRAIAINRQNLIEALIKRGMFSWQISGSLNFFVMKGILQIQLELLNNDNEIFFVFFP